MKVTQIYSTVGLLTTMFLCKFGENPSICSEDIASGKANFNIFHGLVTLKIRSRSPNLINSRSNNASV